MPSIDDKNVREILRDLISFNESSGRMFRTVYLDTKNIPTIGHGFNLDRPGARAAIGAVGADYDRIRAGTDALTDAQIRQLFQPDVDSSIEAARRVVKNFAQLNLERQFIIVDMVYQNGEAGFAKYVGVLRELKKLDFQKAADEMKSSTWYTQSKKRGVRNVASMRSGKLESAEYDKFQQALDQLANAAGANKAQKDAREAKASVKEGKDGKEASKESKETKDGKDAAKERKEGKETKEGKEKETAKETKDGKDGSKESKEGKDSKETSKETKDRKDGKDGSKERKETKDGKETKEGKDGKETKEGKETKDGPDVSAGFPDLRGMAQRPPEHDRPSWDRYSV